MLIIEEGADGEWGAASTAAWWDAGSQLSRCHGDASWRRGARVVIRHSNVTWQPEHPARAPNQNKPNTKMAAAGNE